MGKSRYKFNGKLWGGKIFKRIADEQTKRLMLYAQMELDEIVLSREFDDRTRNLADSYLWCVYYNGKCKGSGTYGRKRARKLSLLHEWSKDPSMRIPVNGRALTKEFKETYKPTQTDGWEVVFAACAPYSAYLEGGFKIHGRRYQFDVMSQRYDHIKGVFEPLGKVTLYVSPPLY